MGLDFFGGNDQYTSMKVESKAKKMNRKYRENDRNFDGYKIPVAIDKF